MPTPPHSVDAADDLSGFRWHTGATLRPLAPGEPCPVLFRDVGPEALALFLRGRLPRLAGPLSPIVYTRTAGYVEPYTDYERTGRLVILRPTTMRPWHSGLPHIYVARARHGVDGESVGFIPGDVPLTNAAERIDGTSNVRELKDALGGRAYDEAVAESLHRLDRFAGELERTEERAAPLRKLLRSPDCAARDRARSEMARTGLTESDVCTAWHHLPRERRGWIEDALARVSLHE
jgi:hypothetical protein